MFKKSNISKVLAGTKTQTRRMSKYTLEIGRTYAIRDMWFKKAEGYITITRRFKQKLGAISQEDIRKEGFETLEQFQAEWIRINHTWNPDKVVIVYEFKLAKKPVK